VTLPGWLRSAIAPLLAIMRRLTAQLAYSDETIARVTAHAARVQRLRTVPSIGPVRSAPSPRDAGGRHGASPAGPSLTPGIARVTGAKAGVSTAIAR